MAYPTDQDNFTDTTGAEVLGSAGGGLGLSGLLNAHNTAIEALEAKLGTGSSTASSGTVLRGTGAGTSSWGDADLTTDVTGTLPVANGGTGVTTNAAYAAVIGALLYPVGAIYIATVSTNPTTLLGFGTWSAFGAGKTLVGLDSGDTDFDTVEETGGAKTHAHNLSDSAYAQMAVFNSGGNSFADARAITSGVTGYTSSDGVSSAGTRSGIAETKGVPLRGSTDSGSTVQPYIVVYMWKRTA